MGEITFGVACCTLGGILSGFSCVLGWEFDAGLRSKEHGFFVMILF